MSEYQELLKVHLKTSYLHSEDMPTVQDMIAPIINYFEEQVKATMTNLTYNHDESELATEIVHTVNTMENLQKCFEFITLILESGSEDDVIQLKANFGFTNDPKYSTLKSKEDLNLYTIEHIAPYLIKKIIPYVKKALDQCFIKNSYKEVHVYNNNQNLGLVKVTQFRLEILVKHFATMILLPKDDIFSYDKSSPIWQELYKYATIKQFISKQEVMEGFKLMAVVGKVFHAIIRNHIDGKAETTLKQDFKFTLVLIKDIIYYGLNEAQTDLESLLYLIKPTIEHAFKPVDLCDNPLVVSATALRCPMIGDECMIYLPRWFPKITKDLILKEYATETFNKYTPSESDQFKAPLLFDTPEQILSEISTETPDSIPVRILSPTPLVFRQKSDPPASATFKSLINKIASNFHSDLNEKGIVIHIHGGGFVSMTSAAHRQYLTRWVKNTGMVHFAIDYRLAPKNPYPAAVDDVWQTYLWIINYAQHILGIKSENVVLVGDSAGGNLVMALALRIAKAGLKPPKGCLIVYPALFLSDSHYTPSLLYTLDDMILPYNIMRIILKAYCPEECRPLEDPLISPLIASDELLERLPPIRIVTGTEDPLHDDCWRLLARLRKLKKDAKIILHDGMVHGYLNNVDLKNYDKFVNEKSDLIQELINI